MLIKSVSSGEHLQNPEKKVPIETAPSRRKPAASEGNEVVNIINEQESLPQVPIYSFKIILNITGKKVEGVKSITYKEKLNFIKKDNFIEILVPKVEMFNIIVVHYK